MPAETPRWNPGWEELGKWAELIDMSGPTPGCFRVKPDGSLEPVRLLDLPGCIAADRDRLIDEARD